MSKKKQEILVDLISKFGEDLDEENILIEYPRPQLKRKSYLNLNGIYKCAINKIGDENITFDNDVLVPFGVGTILSKIRHILQDDEVLTYKKEFNVDKEFINDVTILHFGAVDQICEVYLNDIYLGKHIGGYLPFSFDVSYVIKEGNNILIVKVTDVTNKSYYSYGKQSLTRGGMWYTPISGIWQAVWLESLPKCHITKLKITPNIDDSYVKFNISTSTKFKTGNLKIYDNHHTELYNIDFDKNEVKVKLANFILWSPNDPYLYDVSIKIDDDEVDTYFGMRKFSVGTSKYGPCLMLNNKPFFFNGLLDQGYISDGGYTFPTDEALKYDIEEMKKLGFNTLRKHIKIEPLRWYYHCDKLGMIVFQDIVNGGKYDFNLMTLLPTIGLKKFSDDKYDKFDRELEESREYYINELNETIDLLYNTTSLALYTTFNEGWGQFDAKKIASLVKEKDPTRIVDHASGWFDQNGDDINSLHVYFRKIRIKKENRPTLVTEFGGYSYKVKDHVFNLTNEYGYKKFKDNDSYAAAYIKLYNEQIIPNIEKGLAGCIYTQVSDVEDETNGILTYDRKVNKLEAYDIDKLNAQVKFMEEK
jgi:beta-galactosidase/beta-glucuronidase